MSGSGKSTLILEILYKNLAQRLYNSREKAGLCKEIKGLSAIDKVINIDQSPIGKDPALKSSYLHRDIYIHPRPLFTTARIKGEGIQAWQI